jgi:hypothetical protein
MANHRGLIGVVACIVGSPAACAANDAPTLDETNPIESAPVVAARDDVDGGTCEERVARGCTSTTQCRGGDDAGSGDVSEQEDEGVEGDAVRPCPAGQHACACATGFYCLAGYAMCVAPTAACP